jgi:hypothetical protein
MPDWKREIRSRLAGLSLSPTRKAAIIKELSQHLDDYFEAFLSAGLLESGEARQKSTQWSL